MTMSQLPPPKRAYVETYGCQMNISDGELMEGILASQGYEIVHVPEDADIVLVNTCAIREHAERRVLGRVAQLNALKQKKPELILGVTGCMAQRMGESLLDRASHVDLIMGPDAYRGLPDRLKDLESGVSAGVRAAPVRAQLAVLDMDLDEHYEGLEQRRTSKVAAWVPIQRGCDHRCTFCIVPYVRGGEKNREPQEVLDEIREIADSGITEVTLLGQTVNSYRHGAWGFPRLLREVAHVPGIRRVRFTSPHPNDVTAELAETMAEASTVCENLHLPVQSGDERVLKRMVRRHTVGEFLEKVGMV
ncbi:MAG: MiaB/RimO family radical SAM methylthiotransferase, partial [Gemmatimonadetes bacterium]|nr:MiaB/RimO family radical SAM methylthiotransferase [Gemmatimonadota bacterium]